MSVSTLYDMLPTIIDVTVKKKLKWQVDSSGGYFFAAGKNIINIWDKSDQGEDETGFGIRLLDSNKTVIDYIDTNYNYKQIGDYLSTIHKLARRSALDVEKVLEEVYSTLSSL